MNTATLSAWMMNVYLCVRECMNVGEVATYGKRRGGMNNGGIFCDYMLDILCCVVTPFSFLSSCSHSVFGDRCV